MLYLADMLSRPNLVPACSQSAAGEQNVYSIDWWEHSPIVLSENFLAKIQIENTLAFSLESISMIFRQVFQSIQLDSVSGCLDRLRFFLYFSDCTFVISSAHRDGSLNPRLYPDSRRSIQNSPSFSMSLGYPVVVATTCNKGDWTALSPQERLKATWSQTTFQAR